MICNVEDCQNEAVCRGYCNRHYQRLRYYGDPLRGGPERKTRWGDTTKWLQDHKSDADTGACLIWPFSTDGHGYGQMRIGGKTKKAHRIMCELAHGEPPTSEHHAAHSCGNGKHGCVHPQHLRWATIAENEADKLIHGTHNRGVRCGTNKLAESDIHEIRKRRNNGQSHQKIADAFNVSRNTVTSIINGENWAWLS